MFFSNKKTDLTNFTAFRAFYCRCMLKIMRDNLHVKLFFTILCIMCCLAFAYFEYKKADASYRPAYIAD